MALHHWEKFTGLGLQTQPSLPLCPDVRVCVNVCVCGCGCGCGCVCVFLEITQVPCDRRQLP